MITGTSDIGCGEEAEYILGRLRKLPELQMWSVMRLCLWEGAPLTGGN